MQSHLTLTESIGWMVFIYRGAAGVYEVLGGRGWLDTFVVMWLARPGGVLAGLVLLHLAAIGWLVYKVFRLLGKPDVVMH